MFGLKVDDFENIQHIKSAMAFLQEMCKTEIEQFKAVDTDQLQLLHTSPRTSQGSGLGVGSERWIWVMKEKESLKLDNSTWGKSDGGSWGESVFQPSGWKAWFH